MIAEPPAFPKALGDDNDDVAWALQTALARWERGGHADAVVWLRRAAQTALESGDFGRAADLEKSARQVDLWIQVNASAGLAQAEEDDGVDSLLEGDMPAIEARALEGPTPSLVDAIEAEARGESVDVPITEELDEVEELQDEEIVEELPEAEADQGALPSFPLDSVPPPPLEPEPEPAPRTTAGSTGAFEVPSIPSAQPREPRSPELEPEPRTTAGSAGAFEVPSIPSAQPREPRSPEPEPPPIASEPAEKPPSAPLVAREPEPMPPAPMRESDPPPRLAGFERDSSNDDAATLRPAPRVSEPEIDPEVSDDEILLPDAPESMAPPQAAAPAAVARASESPTPPIDADRIAAVRGLEDLTPEIHAELGARARTKTLEPDEEVGGYGLLWVMKGMVMVMPTIADAVIGYATEGQTVFSRGNLETSVALRAVGGPEGAEVAVWQPEHFEKVLQKCPWVADELRAIADRFQALAGASMGLLGERLDDSMRAMVTDRAEVKLLLPGEVIFEQGKAVVGLYVVGAGELELVKGDAVERTLGPGELLFSSAVLSHDPAPALARASATGALVLYFDRMTTHELVVSVPPLLELVAMG